MCGTTRSSSRDRTRLREEMVAILERANTLRRDKIYSHILLTCMERGFCPKSPPSVHRNRDRIVEKIVIKSHSLEQELSSPFVPTT